MVVVGETDYNMIVTFACFIPKSYRDPFNCYEMIKSETQYEMVCYFIKDRLFAHQPEGKGLLLYSFIQLIKRKIVSLDFVATDNVTQTMFYKVVNPFTVGIISKTGNTLGEYNLKLTPFFINVADNAMKYDVVKAKDSFKENICVKKLFAYFESNGVY